MAGDGDWAVGTGTHTGVSPDAQAQLQQALKRHQTTDPRGEGET
eukprot:CAMPEP_0117651852 /NCGR_PEP_ID=MMETSP0804-20121206/2313_1 /TAXON_ID=1074897 /ORGANISM="Tetraselmis astigmatica, Strain CCMP880" /LENGTH=43 /DNA_ID= /DNA_START= /DNA_END= /DNA_ORIENTATION=